MRFPRHQQFHLRSLEMFKPSSLTLDTTSIAFSLIIAGATSASFLAKEIRISLHLGSTGHYVVDDGMWLIF